MRTTSKLKKQAFKRWLTRISIARYVLLALLSVFCRVLNGLSDMDTSIIEAIAITNAVDYMLSGLLYMNSPKDSDTVDREFAVYICLVSLAFLTLDLLTVCFMAMNLFEFSHRSFSYPLIISSTGVYRTILSLVKVND